MVVAVLILILLLSTGWLIFSVVNFVSLLRDKVPYVATPAWVQDWLVAHVPLRDGMTVVDLGCGDGRMLRTLLTKNPRMKAIGYERNWWPYGKALWQSQGLPLTVLRKDFYRADLHDADVVYCFLMPAVMAKVERLLRAQLKPGSLVYSYAFPLPTWEPEQVVANPNLQRKSALYVYRA